MYLYIYITDLYHVDKSDCFISIVVSESLCMLLWIHEVKNCLLALANEGTLTILLAVEEKDFLILRFSYSVSPSLAPPPYFDVWLYNNLTWLVAIILTSKHRIILQNQRWCLSSWKIFYLMLDSIDEKIDQ